jgi:hypothetical protein
MAPHHHILADDPQGGEGVCELGFALVACLTVTPRSPYGPDSSSREAWMRWAPL